MDVQNRSLTQEKAILVARQGDPKLPAPGTLLARQRILHSELATVNTTRTSNAGSGDAAVATLTISLRQPEQIRRDIRRIERELGEVQSRLREIDQLIQAGIDRRQK